MDYCTIFNDSYIEFFILNCFETGEKIKLNEQNIFLRDFHFEGIYESN